MESQADACSSTGVQSVSTRTGESSRYVGGRAWCSPRRPIQECTSSIIVGNIVAGERVVEEFVQGGATAERIGEHVLRLLQDDQARQQMRRKLGEAARKLGSLDAYQEAARRVADWVFLRKEAA